MKCESCHVKWKFCQQSDGAAEETPATKPIVGIIYPPPEVRNIVDKTASFVARLVIPRLLDHVMLYVVIED